LNRWWQVTLVILGLLTVSILSARLNLVVLNYLLIALIIIIVVFIHKINSKYYPLLLFGIGLSLLWQTSLMGQWVVGTDIQEEVYCSQNALLQGWNPFDASMKQSNSSFIVGGLLPWFTFVTDIKIEWVYKIIPPIALASVVCLLYHSFKYQIGEIKAFYSGLFFIIMPVFSLETVMIAKSMFAELFLALMIFALTCKWNKWSKTLTIVTSVVLCFLSHYTVGIIALFYLGIITGVRLVTAPFKFSLFKNRALPVMALVVVSLISLGGFFVYYNTASDGKIVKVIQSVANIYLHVNIGKDKPITLITAGDKGNPMNENDNIKGISITHQPPIVRAGLNMDFMKISLQGKIFRVIQTITQLLILIGGLWLLFKHKQYKFTVEFIVGIGAAFLMLGLCILLPFFSSTINMTRFYHLALFFLAPLLVLGVDAIFDKGEAF
jgi:uncharacterized membrane protein